MVAFLELLLSFIFSGLLDLQLFQTTQIIIVEKNVPKNMAQKNPT